MFLGIDYGTKNIGLAIERVSIALPYDIVTAKEFFDRLIPLIKNEGITGVVIGEASGYDRTGKQAAKFRVFIEKVEACIRDANISIEVHVQDEDLSTFEAQESLEKLHSIDHKNHFDDVAAAIILQRFIDNQM